MIGGGAEITLPPLLGLIPGLFGGIELVDDPLPREHTRLDATGLGNPAELLDPLGRQSPEGDPHRRTAQPPPRDQARRAGTPDEHRRVDVDEHSASVGQPAAVDAAIARSRERYRTSGAFESADLVRADRDARR